MARTFASFLIALPLAVLSVGACGGSAFDGGPGTGGTGAGGTSAVGGGPYGDAGRSVGGSLGVGGSTVYTAGTSSIGGAGNTGGTVSSGGSGGGGVDIGACTSNTQCELVALSCCGTCGEEPLSAFTAINSAYANQYGQRCGDIACEPCPPTQFDPNDPSLYYIATCQVGRCTAVDLRTTDITACSSANDCSLRSGTACCAGCADRPVALNTKNEHGLSSLVCGSEPSACAGCTDPTLPTYAVGCTAGRCSVELAPCSVEHPCTD